MGLLFSLLLDMILEEDGVQEEVESNKFGPYLKVGIPK